MYTIDNKFFEEKFLEEYYRNLKSRNKDKSIEIIRKRISGIKGISIPDISEEDIKDYFRENGSSELAYQTILTSFYLFHPNINPAKDDSFLTDGFNDCSFDAIYINEKDNIIEIFDAKGKETEESKGTGFGEKDLAFLVKNIEKYISLRKTYNGRNHILNLKIGELRKALDEGKTIYIYIFREIEGDPDENYLTELKNIEIELSKNGINIHFRCININEAKQILKYNLLNVGGKTFNFTSINEKKEFIELKYQVGITNQSDSTFLGIASLYEYYNFIKNAYDKIGEKEIYKFNVREDQKSEEILSNIENTIKSDCNNFLHFHNGITIIAENIENSKGNILKLENPQIINGCQSTSAIYSVFSKYFKLKNDIADGNIDAITKDEIVETYKIIDNLKKSSIQLKILPIKINSDRSYTIEKISEYTNTQIKVDKFQLRSNDLIHYILIDYLKQNGFKYKVKSLETQSNKEIAIDELFQLIFAYLYESPGTAKKEKQDIFSIKQDKNGYLEMLNKTNIEEILKIVKSNYIYLEKGTDKDNRKSLYRYFVVLAILFLDKYSKISIDIEITNINTTAIVNDILKIIEELRKSTKYKVSKSDRDVYQVKGDDFWNDLKERIREEYGILVTNKEHIEVEGVNLGIVNEYIKNYGGKGRIRKQHELIKDILLDNNGELNIESIIEILMKLYGVIGRQNDYFSDPKHIEKTILDKIHLFENKEGIVILK